MNTCWTGVMLQGIGSVAESHGSVTESHGARALVYDGGCNMHE